MMRNKLINQVFKTGMSSAFILCSVNVFADDNIDKKGDCDGRRGPPPFTKLDINGDGAITFDEFSKHKIPRGNHETVFSHFDTDNDGKISEHEFNDRKSHPPRRQKRAGTN
ncbi:EF-hand domain-containing protein [Pseudoalteromonas denitrificans]|jgi:hypothetical protein|uniref:EF hand n=1 Tax=Pseudoalteromonas denitrificans DSM 6059 TaxID=1123010 RepID=A0A1I1R6Z8_9GAMM|nr:EF-hand domain-containing protein [Pseudoalteromonas denitrificans]SFD27343.1 EF hand [Pseudoalteromonas denitrificans DSM 6059]